MTWSSMSQLSQGGNASRLINSCVVIRAILNRVKEIWAKKKFMYLAIASSLCFFLLFFCQPNICIIYVSMHWVQNLSLSVSLSLSLSSLSLSFSFSLSLSFLSLDPLSQADVSTHAGRKVAPPLVVKNHGSAFLSFSLSFCHSLTLSLSLCLYLYPTYTKSYLHLDLRFTFLMTNSRYTSKWIHLL